MGSWKKNYGGKKTMVKNVIFGLSGKKLRLSGLKSTKVMQGRIKNTVKWKINYESYAWVKKNYGRMDKKLR